MPVRREWGRFWATMALCVGSGYVVLNYCVPTDEQFVKQLSPELRQRYEREKALRARANQIMRKRVEETIDRPAWLQSNAEKVQFEANILAQARSELESEERDQHFTAERDRLKELAKKEK